MGRLTAIRVRSAKKPGRYGDGQGLILAVGKSGSRSWILRVQAKGKRRDIGLGSAAYVSLSEARAAVADIRRAIREGRDPVAEKRARKVEKIPTFREAALRVHEEHAPSWKNPKHAAQWLSTLEQHVFPAMGGLLVSDVSGPMVRDVLAEIWLTIPETARRVRQRIGTVLDWAHAKGWREAEAPLRAISRGLPKQPRKGEHFPAMPWASVPDFLVKLAETMKAGETVQLALEFLILTAVRSGEMRGARWGEIDLEAK
jgi:integrase